uniref:Uncharacterized protein n=1 Tax=Plectus sambesii TaxID=2011161 RepID=A0A914WT72_9BILA
MRLNNFYSYFLFLLTIVLFKVLLFKEDSPSQLSNVTFRRLFDRHGSRGTPAKTRNSDKWIVITTISLPTDAVRVLADQPGWRVVVVADKKTPIDWDFFNCDFLSLEKQAQLGYELLPHVPYNSYTRKMLGYLHAIEHGAKWIYDTDDDNQPIGLGLQQFDATENITGMAYGELLRKTAANDKDESGHLFNPYAYFGQPKMWPRGYPLEEINKENKMEHFRLCNSRRTPVIQQGLVKKDPDVDAIYRLINAKSEKDGLNLQFNTHAPPILVERGTFSPFNSQNTLFHKDAFWALFLPISVAFRVTDIWRSYFAQKLLHLTGNTLGFYPENAIQRRNPHSYLADFLDEAAIYKDAGRLVKYLSSWNCTRDTLDECMLELSSGFVRERFWTEDDVEMIKAWIKSLKSVGYEFSRIQNISAAAANEKEVQNACRKAYLQFPIVTDEQRTELARNSFKDLGEWCSKSQPIADTCIQSINLSPKGIWGKLRLDTALIITFSERLGQSVGVLQRLYEPFFATVILCGLVLYEEELLDQDPLKTDFPPVKPFSYISVASKDMSGGFRAYICTVKAIELRLQNIAGYMVISDDTVYNFWNDIDLSRFRLPTQLIREPNDLWWGNTMGVEALDRSVATIEKEIKSHPNSTLAQSWNGYSEAVGGDGFSVVQEYDVWAAARMYYLPKRNETVFYDLANIFFDSMLYNDVAIPKLAAAFQWLDYYKDKSMHDISTDRFVNLVGDDRGKWEEKYRADLLYLNPLKLKPSMARNLHERQKYCHRVVRTFHQAVVKSTKAEKQ